VTETGPWPSRADAVVIGSGLAGMSAAVRLADAGRRVVVVEEAPRLGGRATSFMDRVSGERVDNGQHALFGCYRDTYDLLRRIGAAHLAPLQPRLTLTMAGPDERGVETLVCPNLPAPWHLFAGLMRWRALGVRDRLSALRLGKTLRAVARRGAAAIAGDVPPDQTVSDWLVVHGQTPALCDWLWRPLAIAALNQSPDVAAAAPFVRVLAELFAPDQGAAAIGLATVPLDDLFAAPAAALVISRGGQVLTRASARVLVDSGRATGVRIAGDRDILAPTVISSVPWYAVGRLWEGDPPEALRPIATHAAAMQSSPIVTANLWLDPPARDVMPAPFVGFVSGPMHWAFCKGTRLASGAEHVSVVASGADDILRLENDQIAAQALSQLQRAIPAMRTRRLRHSVVVREPRATFSLAPGGPPRPRALTSLGGFLLAGDWTDTGLPGTIESAVRSGYAAADAVLASGSTGSNRGQTGVRPRTAEV